MKDYCTCESRRIDQAFLSGSLVYCSRCDKPFCCDEVDPGSGVRHHAAEIANEERFACWRHWDSVMNLEVFHAVVGK